MTIKRTSIFGLVLLFFAFSLSLWPAFGQEREKAQTQGSKKPLSEVLKPDGTLRVGPGIQGSFDPKGFRMITGKDGSPNFVPSRLAQDAVEPGLNADGDEKWDPRFGLVYPNNAVYTVAVVGTDVYVGGSFTQVDGIPGTNHIGKWDGMEWSALGLGVDDVVYDIAVGGQDIYVGGSFRQAGGITANCIAKWNTLTNTWSSLGAGINDGISGGGVNTITVSGLNVYVGGGFSKAGDISPANCVAVWNEGTDTWSTMGSGVQTITSWPPQPCAVFSIAVLGGYVYVGGYFNTAGDSSANSVARWNGSTWDNMLGGVTSPEPTYWWGTVRKLLIYGSWVYVGGSFEYAGGSSTDNLAIWTGSSWTTIYTGTNGGILDVYISGTDVYLAGDFTVAGGISANHIVKYAYSTDTWSALGSGLNESVWTMCPDSTGLYVGGEFTMAGGKPSNYFGYWGVSWDTITVVSPNGGESLVAGSSYPITWTGFAGPVKIEYSTDNGATWTTILEQAAALSVTPADGFTSSGKEGGPFTPASKDYTLQNTGNWPLKWQGETGAITTLSATSGSLAAGASTTVTASIDAVANGYTPGVYNDNIVFLNATNGIGSTTRPVTLTVTPLYQPDLVIGSLTGTLTPTGGGFTAVVSNIGNAAAAASVLRMTLRRGTTTIATEDFNVPALGIHGTFTQDYIITVPVPAGTYTLIARADATNVVAESDETNNTASITKTVSSPVPDLMMDTFDFNVHGPAIPGTDDPIVIIETAPQDERIKAPASINALCYYAWTVPNVSSSQCLIRISDLADGVPSDMSNAVFSIEPVVTPGITVTSPNGGESWEVGSVRNITWTSTGTVGNVMIDYSSDNGSYWTTIMASTANDGTHPWTVPDALSTTCLVRVSETDGSPTDTSDAVFSFVPAPAITVTSPNGGESWEVGSVHNITWTGTGTVGNVMIDYTTDGGSTWTPIVASTANDGTHPWAVPSTLSTTYRIRVSETDGSPTDMSDAVFSIVAVPAITVTSPNGGESWSIGSTHNILWTCAGISGDVTILLTQGPFEMTLGTSPASSGAFTWEIDPGLSVGNDYRIRVYQAAVEDYSDGNFSLIEAQELAKDDFVGTWDGQGVYYRNSDTGAFVKLASPATKLAVGDLDGDGIDDLIGLWPGQGGIWVKYSQSGAWARLSSTAQYIAAGDMNGDGRSDLVGTWDGQGVFYRNSITGAWVKLASPATMVTAGDIDNDGTDDLIGLWPSQGGIWIKYSQTGAWARLSSTAVHIACGDMNGDERDDLLGTWDGQGAYYRDSETGIWVKMASPATLITTGDIDGDATDDLIGIWPTQGGVWVKYSSDGTWERLSSTAQDIAAGKMRAAAGGGKAQTEGVMAAQQDTRGVAACRWAGLKKDRASR